MTVGTARTQEAVSCQRAACCKSCTCCEERCHGAKDDGPRDALLGSAAPKHNDRQHGRERRQSVDDRLWHDCLQPGPNAGTGSEASCHCERTEAASSDFRSFCWSKLKALLREFGARTRDTLDNAIRRAMDLIDSADAGGWFRHCGYGAHLN